MCLWGSEEGDGEISASSALSSWSQAGVHAAVQVGGWMSSSGPGMATDQPPGPLCYLSRRIVTEPRGDGPVEGAKRGDLAAERGAGQRGYSLQSQGF